MCNSNSLVTSTRIMLQLFAADVPNTVPVIPVGPADVVLQLSSPASSPNGAAASSSAPYVPPRQRRAAEAKSGTTEGAPTSQRYHEDTLDESVISTIMRDARSIWGNLKLVCAPFSKQDDLHSMLKHWDLWGPLVRPGPCCRFSRNIA